MTGSRKSEPHHNPGHRVDILLTKQEIADRFGVHPGTVQMWWNKGFLAAHKIKPGQTVRCYSTESDVVEWAKIFYNVGIQPGIPSKLEGRNCPVCGQSTEQTPADTKEPTNG